MYVPWLNLFECPTLTHNLAAKWSYLYLAMARLEYLIICLICQVRLILGLYLLFMHGLFSIITMHTTSSKSGIVHDNCGSPETVLPGQRLVTEIGHGRAIFGIVGP